MTLDEVIEVYKESIKEYEFYADVYARLEKKENIRPEDLKFAEEREERCKRMASLNRQIAVWLTELKDRRGADDIQEEA